MTRDPLRPASGADIPDLDAIDYATITMDGTTLTMTGEIDTTVIQAWQRQHPLTPRVEHVQASDVTFINSAGLAYLVTLLKAVAPTRLTLHTDHRAVLRPLEQMGLHSLLDISS